MNVVQNTLQSNAVQIPSKKSHVIKISFKSHAIQTASENAGDIIISLRVTSGGGVGSQLAPSFRVNVVQTPFRAT